MSKRLLFLERTVAEGSKDPFAHYCLAQEYRSLGRTEDSLRTFSGIRQNHPNYLAAYLMAAQLLEELGRREESAEWCRVGIERAQAARDAHTVGELEALLARVSGA
jgi:tetratricopeptide (TPR) repeat protein